VPAAHGTRRVRSPWPTLPPVLARHRPLQRTSTLVSQGRLRAIERDRLRAFVAAAIDILEPLHADDFQLINPGGRVLTKDEYLGGVASGQITYLDWEPASEIAVRLYGEAAALRYQSNTTFAVSGETFVLRNWHIDVYERRDGRWQVVWSQATAIQ
jgi:hypothetical protein